MYELIQLGTNTFYMDCPAKVGFYKTGENTVVLIDAGSDKDAAKKVKNILEAQHWTPTAIFSTHSHADHTGGNQYLQNTYNCKIYAPGVDLAVTRFPILEPVSLYGGFPMKELHNKFLMAKESMAEELTAEALPKGLEVVPLPGHSYSMAGFRTSDDVVFLADALSSKETLDKYRICFLYDVASYLSTLEKIRDMKAQWFVPAHVPQLREISELAEHNIQKTLEVAEKIKSLLTVSKTFECLLAEIFTEYDLTMNLQQRFLIGSTVKSYLSYLKDLDQIEYIFENNMMLWKQKI